MTATEAPVARLGDDAATFRVHSLREAGPPERAMWCVSNAGREMGRFASAESALRAAMAYARASLQKGEVRTAIVARARDVGPDVTIHLAAFG